MSSALRLAALTYLALCLVAGGSAQGVWNNLLIQWSGLALIVWTLAHTYRWPSPGRPLALILFLALAWVLLQLVPLPPSVWSSLPGRALIAQGFDVAGQSRPWLPVSLDWNVSLATLFAAIPGIALLLVAVRDDGTMARNAALVVLSVATAGILLGILQLSGEEYYLYPISNVGAAAGFFANSNHMAALLLSAIPLFAALVARLPGQMTPMRWLFVLIGGSVLLTGIATNGSFAILLLGAPVTLASALLIVPPGRIRVGRMVIVTGLLALAGTAFLIASAVSGLSSGNLASVTVRHDIWTQTLSLIREFGLIGTGLGTYPAVYPLAEDPGAVDWFYINHAHNDLLELVVELGLPGLAFLVAFLGWWLKRTIALWRRRQAVHYARAATIASGALMLHSLVDYPLRTGALIGVFGMCLGLMVAGGGTLGTAARGKYGARHLTLEDLD